MHHQTATSNCGAPCRTSRQHRLTHEVHIGPASEHALQLVDMQMCLASVKASASGNKQSYIGTQGELTRDNMAGVAKQPGMPMLSGVGSGVEPTNTAKHADWP